jgi:hypothetical protein
VAEQNISYVLRQRCMIEFCVKLGKVVKKLRDVTDTYGLEAMS